MRRAWLFGIIAIVALAIWLMALFAWTQIPANYDAVADTPFLAIGCVCVLIWLFALEATRIPAKQFSEKPGGFGHDCSRLLETLGMTDPMLRGIVEGVLKGEAFRTLLHWAMCAEDDWQADPQEATSRNIFDEFFTSLEIFGLAGTEEWLPYFEEARNPRKEHTSA